MDTQLSLVIALLGTAMILFVAGRPRMDVVALLMLLCLPATGTVSVPEVLAGFANPNVVLIALLFVIGEGLVRTGVAQGMGDWMTRRAGASEARLIVLLMLCVALLSSFMSSTGVVALFIPIVLRIARRSAVPAGRLMMPLSMAALLAGMLTLVATPPNLIVHAELVRRGMDGFAFFAFLPIGLPMLALGIGYMLLVRRSLGGTPAPTASARPRLSDWVRDYGLAAGERRWRIAPGSPLAGQRLDALDLRASAGVHVVAIERPGAIGRQLIHPQASTVLQTGDVMMIDRRPLSEAVAAGGGTGSRDDAIAADGVRGDGLDRFAQASGLAPAKLSGAWFTDLSQEVGMAQILIPPESRLIGQTLAQARFRTVHDLSVIGVRHGVTPVPGAPADEPLRAGDTLLAVGPWRAIRRLAEARHDMVLLDLPVEADDAVPAASRAPIAVAIVGLVVALMATGVVANVTAALLGCLLLGLFRCIDIEGAYRAIHWQSLVLIVGMLPFALALERTGGVGIVAGGLIDLTGEAAPRVALAALFLATAALSLFISNTATAVLMAPVALAVADGLDAMPYPFAITVALAASAAFVTPVSSPVNMLVVGPGGYSFGDFFRIGGPFALLSLVVVVFLVPVVFPL